MLSCSCERRAPSQHNTKELRASISVCVITPCMLTCITSHPYVQAWASELFDNDYTHTYIHIYTIHTYTHVHALTHTCIHARIHTHAYTRAHSHTRAHTHTHTHTKHNVDTSCVTYWFTPSSWEIECLNGVHFAPLRYTDAYAMLTDSTVQRHRLSLCFLFSWSPTFNHIPFNLPQSPSMRST